MGSVFSAPSRFHDMDGETAPPVNQFIMCGFISTFKMFCRTFSATLR
jgi:hypothetical protein